MKKNIKIQELEDKINTARYDYYNEQPKISDEKFDQWIDELSKLDPQNKAIHSIGAVLPKITCFEKIKHEIPMQSLNKVNTADELATWAKECDSDVHCKSGFLICEKLDGISVSTIWENGKLVLAATRGSGEIGEAITANVIKMKGIPKEIKGFTGSIRGEIVLLKPDFDKHFADYSNQRNAASGIAKRFDGEGVQHLTVLTYTVSSGKEFKTEEEQFKWLQKSGLKTPNFVHCPNLDAVNKIYDEYGKHLREKLEYMIDGLVVRLNDIDKQQSLGEKSHRPQGQRAYKFAAPRAESTLRAIQDQVGSTGRITPVAEFDTVDLGAEINRASLYNYKYIDDLELDIGAKIVVHRANDVIPRVESVVKKTGTIYKAPKKCPSCGSKTEFQGEYLLCSNKLDCPAQKLGKLEMWISEQNILDWSTKTLEKLIEANLVDDVADLYKLKPEQIEKLDRMGPTIAKKLVEILNGHRNLTLQNLIGGLGIEGVATTTTKLIVDSGYDTLEKMYAMTQSQLEGIPGFGSIRAKAFYDGIRMNKKRIENILISGVTIKEKIMGNLNGKTFCFTGALSIKRAEAEKMVEDNGGSCKSSVGKGLDFLVIADPTSNSSKAVKARSLGTKCIDEKEFLSML